MAAKRKVMSIENAAAAPAAAMASGAEAWIEAQEMFLAEIDQVAQSWVKRRREAIEETRRALDEINRNPDPGALFLAQQHWLSGSIQRVVSDFGDWSALTLKCLGRTGDRMFEASQRARGAAEEGLATAGDKPGFQEEEAPPPPA
jgi:hypothetical protein